MNIRQTPILFLIFNRPDKTQTVFGRIREAKPARLFVAADGPRPDKPGETELCNQTREDVLSRIDWPCEVKTLFREENLGCKLAVSSAITWFFEQVEEGIILEDDCLPDLSFFQFCEELLEKYRDNEQVMMISGDNFQPDQRGDASYYFSRFIHIWGWATWRRAWEKYDLEMKKWPAIRKQRMLYEILPSRTVRQAEKLFDTCFSKQTSTWDFQWFYACLTYNGLSVMPKINLVTNIDSGGTHMKVYDPCIHLPSEPMPFPLQHPPEIKPDKKSDLYTQRYIYFRSSWRALELILRYLWTNLRKDPSNILFSIKSVLNNCRQEIRRRQSLSSTKKSVTHA
jgi:hypothetical protein